MVRYDDLLNGSGAAPAYDTPVPTALPTRPQDGTTDATRSADRSSTKAVTIAWVTLLALLVAAHVITVGVQA